jgi:hypothetical protein
MSEQREINGQCLCGEVTVTATVTDPVMRACHCDMCRRHTSSMFMSLPAENIEFKGPTKTFQSSEWAERGFCGTCGSTLWYGMTGDGHINPSAGLFDNAGDAALTLEFFTDVAPKGYALAGDHRKMTTEQTMALFAPDKGDTE